MHIYIYTYIYILYIYKLYVYIYILSIHLFSKNRCMHTHNWNFALWCLKPKTPKINLLSRRHLQGPKAACCCLGMPQRHLEFIIAILSVKCVQIQLWRTFALLVALEIPPTILLCCYSSWHALGQMTFRLLKNNGSKWSKPPNLIGALSETFSATLGYRHPNVPPVAETLGEQSSHPTTYGPEDPNSVWFRDNIPLYFLQCGNQAWCIKMIWNV